MENTKPDLLINPVVRWAVHPADQGTITYIDGMADSMPLPKENDLITRPFLVDPQTGRPVPVRVAQILKLWNGQQHTLAVVVARAH